MEINKKFFVFDKGTQLDIFINRLIVGEIK